MRQAEPRGRASRPPAACGARLTRAWYLYAFIALATLTWQPVFFAAAAGAAVAALLAERTGKLKALLLIAVGGLIPTAITVGAYVATGQLKLFVDDFLLINAEYTKQTWFTKIIAAAIAM